MTNWKSSHTRTLPDNTCKCAHKHAWIAIPSACVILWTNIRYVSCFSKFTTGQNVCFLKTQKTLETKRFGKEMEKTMLSYHAPKRPSHACLRAAFQDTLGGVKAYYGSTEMSGNVVNRNVWSPSYTQTAMYVCLCLPRCVYS